MTDVVFVTGNPRKVDYLARYLGHPIEHANVELDEIQALDFTEVVRHKVRQAYERIGRPVLVEDSGIEFSALGKLPGPFTRWFIDELTLAGLCRLVDGKDRSAVARCVFGFYDGTNERYFEGALPGRVADEPKGTGGFGFDPILVPDGYDMTRAELPPEDDRATYLKMKPFERVKDFLEGRAARR